MRINCHHRAPLSVVLCSPPLFSSSVFVSRGFLRSSFFSLLVCQRRRAWFTAGEMSIARRVERPLICFRADISLSRCPPSLLSYPISSVRPSTTAASAWSVSWALVPMASVTQRIHWTNKVPRLLLSSVSSGLVLTSVNACFSAASSSSTLLHLLTRVSHITIHHYRI
jgi:hypothetical protein